jgi:hypothetical protein
MGLQAAVTRPQTASSFNIIMLQGMPVAMLGASKSWSIRVLSDEYNSFQINWKHWFGSYPQAKLVK